VPYLSVWSLGIVKRCYVPSRHMFTVKAPNRISLSKRLLYTFQLYLLGSFCKFSPSICHSYINCSKLFFLYNDIDASIYKDPGTALFQTKVFDRLLIHGPGENSHKGASERARCAPSEVAAHPLFPTDKTNHTC